MAKPDPQPGWIVLKFGGTSVSTRQAWETIAAVVRQRRDEGFRPLVVCSALSGVSNALEELLAEAVGGRHEPVLARIRRVHEELAAGLGLDAEALLGEAFEELSRSALGASLVQEASPRLTARVLAVGERMSTILGAAFLKARGLGADWQDAREMLTASDPPELPAGRRYLTASCGFEPDPALGERLTGLGAEAIVTQGFIARNGAGDTVLLGRGGSDTSAAYLAAKLQAARLEIWTDVPGLFTANPRQIPSARLLRHLGYDEAQEVATMGAKVLHPRCLGPVQRFRIPIHIRWTEHPEVAGTIVSAEAPDFGAQVKALSVKTGTTLLSVDTLGMWQQVGFLADLFAVFRRHGLSVDLVATSETNVTVSLDPTANALDPAVLEAVLSDLNVFSRAVAIGPCAVVSLIGRHIRSILHELGPAFEVFEEQQVYLVSQAASDLNFTFVVDQEQAARLLRNLHAQLFGRREPDQLLGPSWRELFEGETASAEAVPWWRERRGELLALAAKAGPLYVYDEGALRASAAAARSISAVDRLFYAIKANPHPEVLRIFEQEGLGFECVSPGELQLVRGLFPGLGPGRLLFTPNFAPREEYAFGFEAGAHVTLDNLYPLEAWPELFRGREVFVRVDPGRGHGHHKHVRTAGSQSKFGVSPEELGRLRELAETAGVRVVGLHAHLGSGIVTGETWAETALFLASLAEGFPEARVLNVGGGLGVAERPGTTALDLAALAQSLDTFKEARTGFELWMEPGRFLVAQAGVLLARVTQVKRKGAVRYVGLETGMNSLVRPALYGAYHEMVNLTRLDEPLEITAEVVGPICESGDVLGHGRRLPVTAEGDVLLIATAGAYGHAMSSRYNLREPAGEALLPQARTGV